MTLAPSQSWSINDWADYWRYQIGVNVIPADTRNKTPLVEWKSYQNVPILEERHDQWKQENVFSKGIAIIVGKIWHNPDKKGLYLNFIDLDNKKAIEAFCTRNGVNTPLKELAKHMIIEQHSDEPNKAHAFCYSTHPFKKKSSDRISDLSDKIDTNEIPAIEIKGSGENGLAFVTPSPHKNGYNYEIVDTLEPETLDVLELHLDSILREHGLTYLNDDGGNGKSLTPIQDLFQDQTKIYEGHNRHEALLRVMESLIKRNFSILSLEQIRQLSHDWNKQHCVPPLEETEEEQQWKDAIRFIDKSTKYDGKNNADKEESDRQQQTNAEILVDLAEDNMIQFFRDQYGTAFASVTIQDHNEVIALESGRFKRYLAKLFYDNNDKSVVGADAINNSIQILQAKAEYGGHTIPLSVRVAWSTSKDVICYDLTDEKWRCVEIRKDDWGIINNSPPLFVRYNQISQVLPERTYLPNVFDRFLNLTNLKDENNKLLLKVYIIATFIPEIAHPMLILHGEKGSAKSTLQTLIKRLVDPSKPVLLTVHNDRNEFVQQLAHNHVAYYDNIKYTPRWLSDEACKAVTGVGQTKRKLYTNDEDIVYEYKRCLGFNGINVSLTEPDALDRSIMIELQRIPKESRQLESNIYSEFEQIKPKLLGYIFDVLSKALQIKDTIRLNDLPRMADFALWGETIARSMGYKPLQFMDILYDNIGKQNIEAIEAHPLGQAIVKLYEELEDNGKKEWFSTTSECLDKLNEIAAKSRIDTDSKLWPKAANSLSRAVNRIRSNLLEGLGIEVTVSRVTSDNSVYKKNTSTLKIRKIPPLPPLPPPDENQARILTETSGDIVDSGDIIPPPDKIPPLDRVGNHAQITSDIDQSGDSGHSGGIIRTSGEEGSKTKSKFLNCPFCKFENIHPEVLEHHIRFTHNDGSDYNSKTLEEDGNKVEPSRGVADITNLPPPKAKEEVIE